MEVRGYGFNKSAAAYAMIASGQLPEGASSGRVLAASMSLEAGNTDKLGVFFQEARRMGIEVRRQDFCRGEGRHPLHCAKSWQASFSVEQARNGRQF
jgi:DNA polymerase-3 subunit alpha